MKKTIHSIITIALVSCTFATQTYASTIAESPAIENEATPISITVEKNSIILKNAEGQVAQIYSITGELVYNQHIETSYKTIETSSFQKGCYIVKVGKTTRKVIIK